ncbi:MAG: glycosyltransferase [Gammaproteobacteria bacterium]|nr:glycosyltransferase [Gammaproteobacteria bacterium]
MQTDRGREWLRREVPYAHGTAIPNPCVFPLAESEPRIAPDDVMPAESHLLLAVGRLSEEKQFKLLVQTFSNLAPRFPHWNLAILGEGAERQAIEAQIAAAGLSGRIFLPGRVGNVSTWYDRADLYVMSSRFEGFPNSLLEALAYGLAAVSFDCATGPSDLIDDGVNGFLVPPTKGAAGLLERLALLMSNPDIRAEFATQAAVVRERYSISQVGENWDRVLGLGCRDN